jgi:hypothetical protein
MGGTITLKRAVSYAPTPFDVAARWRDLSEEIIAVIQERCLRHPKSTLRETEAAHRGLEGTGGVHW